MSSNGAGSSSQSKREAQTSCCCVFSVFSALSRLATKNSWLKRPGTTQRANRSPLRTRWPARFSPRRAPNPSAAPYVGETSYEDFGPAYRYGVDTFMQYPDRSFAQLEG
jgi:hypothetical protein